MKKKNFFLRVSLLFVLMLLLGFCGTCYAIVLDKNIVKEYANIMYTQNRTDNTGIAKTIMDLLYSTEFENEEIDIENFTNCTIYCNKGNDVNLNYSRTVTIADIGTTNITIMSKESYKVNSNISRTKYTFTVNYSNNQISSIVYNGESSDTMSTSGNYTNITTNGFSYLLFDNITNTNNYDYYGWNQYYGITTRGQSANVTEENEPRPIADAYIGNVYTNIDYNVYYLSNGIKTYYNGQITTYTNTVTNGHTTIIAVNKSGIVNGATYYIEIVQGQTILATSSGIILTTNNSGSGGESGGESGGNVDLTDTNNKIDSVKEEITTQGNAIISALESGEQKAEERDNFWKETYNNLFTLDSGDVEELFQEVEEKIGLPSGEIADLTMVLDYLKGEPRRFCNFMEKI